MSRNLKILIGASLFFNFIALGLIIRNFTLVRTIRSLDAQRAQYPLIAGRIIQRDPPDILISFLNLRNSLRSEVDPWGDNFGLYFEYLPTGSSIGVNSGNDFFAASLFKVPVIMAYYHKLERTGADKNQVLTVQKQDLDKEFGSLWEKGAGYQIKATDAVKLALENSDNTAAKVIADQVDDSDFQDVYQALDIDLQTATGGAVMTVKNYTTILQALYFSAVLQKQDSEEILNYLTMSKFNDGLVAGVAPETTVAHKIGDYRDANNNKEFMDCGIVYLQNRNYTLCMYSVSDQKTANERMSQVSKKVYDYVSEAK